MNPHSDTQSKPQVDTEVLSERTLSCHDLCHRPQAKHLDTERSNKLGSKMMFRAEVKLSNRVDMLFSKRKH